ncbi:MAG: hypothetical protein OCD01_06970 [Fibrobacterales bacterium]
MIKYLSILIALSTSLVSAQGKCASSYFYDSSHHHSSPTDLSMSVTHTSKKVSASHRLCTHIDFNDSVYSFESEHFVLYYTRTGIHKIAGSTDNTYQKYLDTMGIKLEQAYNFYTDSLQLDVSKPFPTSYQYDQPAIAGKYTIEIVDVHHLRSDKRTDLQDDIQFEAIYGFVVPNKEDFNYTHMFVENDYLYTYRGTPEQLFESPQGTCSYYESNTPIISESSGATVSYASEKEKAFDVTVVHELYHAFQFNYEKNFKTLHFWFEASATGMEDILSPDINDYWQYTNSLFNSPDSSILTTNRKHEYGQGLFLHYILHRFPNAIEKQIWEHRAANAGSPIAESFDFVFSTYYNTTFNEVYNDYSAQLLFSGLRSSSDPDPFNSDMSQFPMIYPETLSTQSLDSIILSTSLTAKTFDLESIKPGDSIFVTILPTISLSLIEIDTLLDTAIVTSLSGPTIKLIGDSLTNPSFLTISYKASGSSSSQSNGIIQITVSEEEITLTDPPPLPPKISPPYPNPFNYRNITHERITFPADNIPVGTTITIFSRKGVVVQTLTAQTQTNQTGHTEFIWNNALSSTNSKLPSGYYYYIDSFHNKPKKIIILN